MHTQICDEYLGDIDAAQLRKMLLSLSKTNDFFSSIPEIFGGAVIDPETPLMLMADFEYAWGEEDDLATTPKSRRFVGLRIRAAETPTE